MDYPKSLKRNAAKCRNKTPQNTEIKYLKKLKLSFQNGIIYLKELISLEYIKRIIDKEIKEKLSVMGLYLLKVQNGVVRQLVLNKLQKAY